MSRPRPSPIARAGRFLRTARHLRPRQIVSQLLHRCRPRRSPRRRKGAAAAGPAPPVRWPPTRTFPAPAEVQPSALAGVLTFQSRAVEVGFPPDWNRADLPGHWLYHLHYHDYLWGLPFERARECARHWMDHHRPGPGRIGWDPYPTSLRVANWCALFLGRHRARTLADAAFRDALWTSVHRQAAHLARNLEWRLLGNHLLENGVALALAGSAYAHPDADRWLRTGRWLLWRELPEQMLADGGHFERSPMYQCRVLYALLLLRASGAPVLEELAGRYIAPAARALAALTHPDGGVALLNDSALGVYPEPRALLRAGGAPPAGEGPFALAESGYYGARSASGAYVVCDAGPLGPDYQLGHGHADLFTFELSLAGARVVVDSGVATYEPGPLRDYCRSTRAHNTVEIEGEDSAETWAAFRVGRRCRPRGVAWAATGEEFELSARHDGYRHLPGRPTHARSFRWRGGGLLEISDRIEASRPVRAIARLHFHPDCRLGGRAGQTRTVSFPGGRARVTWSGWEAVVEEESWYCPEFGIALANPCLAFSGAGARVRGTIRIGAR